MKRQIVAKEIKAHDATRNSSNLEVRCSEIYEITLHLKSILFVDADT
jgi:hypothetical protein